MLPVHTRREPISHETATVHAPTYRHGNQARADPERSESPFDIYDWRYIEYSHDDLPKLASWLRAPSILAVS